MKKLLILLLLASCSHSVTGPRFTRGTCISPEPTKLEKWEDPAQAAKVNLLVLDVGVSHYLILAPSPFGPMPQQALISQIDESWGPVECPPQTGLLLEKFPEFK